eukprot:jgi/Botrbrau1/10317/Bobra.0120s0030.1
MLTANKRFFSPASGVNKRGIRVEANIKLPTGGRGMWPAFWLMPQEEWYGPWPESGEIDIMEAINMLDVCYGTAHVGNPLLSQGGQTAMGSTVPKQDYHRFAIDWTSTGITWLLDGWCIIVCRAARFSHPTQPAEPRVPVLHSTDRSMSFSTSPSGATSRTVKGREASTTPYSRRSCLWTMSGSTPYDPRSSIALLRICHRNG